MPDLLNSNNSFLNQSVNNVAILSSSVKYYFDIDNSYVVSKIRTILVPFLNKNWERIPEQVRTSPPIPLLIRSLPV